MKFKLEENADKNTILTTTPHKVIINNSHITCIFLGGGYRALELPQELKPYKYLAFVEVLISTGVGLTQNKSIVYGFHTEEERDEYMKSRCPILEERVTYLTNQLQE